MKLNRTILFLIAWTGWIHVASQPAAGYYDNVLNLSGKELQQALHELIGNHRVVPYDSLYYCFTRTDVRNDSIVWDMYSDTPGREPVYLYVYGKGWECGNYNSEADCYNREHSFPKSWFKDLAPMNSDLFHIYLPTDMSTTEGRTILLAKQKHLPGFLQMAVKWAPIPGRDIQVSFLNL